MHIFVGFHNGEDVVLVARVAPGFLDSNRCLLPRLLYLVKQIPADENPCHRLDSNGCVGLFLYLAARLKFD